MINGARISIPQHDATIPFTRMIAGPMDYTPGAMVNMDKANFSPNFYPTGKPGYTGTSGSFICHV